MKKNIFIFYLIVISFINVTAQPTINKTTHPTINKTTHPAVTVDIEPLENNQVVYASIAAPFKNQKPHAHLALLLKIKNNENKEIKLERIGIIYIIGTTEFTASNIAVNKTIPKNDFIYWNQRFHIRHLCHYGGFS